MLDQDRIVRKEVALGQIRDIAPPQGHIGLQIAPFEPVDSDDVIFEYITPEVTGLVPARAEDAESELAQKDDSVGEGRASLIDWAEKLHYDASDVTRYREYLAMAALAAGGSTAFPLTAGRMTETMAAKFAKDRAGLRKKIDNRIEWLVLQALVEGVITYDDGKIKFSVDYQRPANQQDEAPAGGLWSLTTSDPIGDANAIIDTMFTAHGVTMGQGWCSRKVARSLLNSDRWAARSGMASTAGGGPVDPAYLIAGWSSEQVLAVFEAQTGIKLHVYDSVYRTRAIGSTTTVNNRFMADNKLVLLPKAEEIAELEGGGVGFAKTLTSPHPEGDWQSGFYEWEQGTKDPWGQDVGAGIKAFPVFPYLEYTYVATVLA